MSDDVEALREERKRKLAEAMEQQNKEQELEGMKKALLVRVLTPEAYERMMNIKLSSKNLYDKAIQVVVYLYQNKKINEANRLDDAKLKNLLSRMINTYEPTIEFKRKGDD